MRYPPVSCLCLTYARPHVLEEALESFLRQDYPGETELLVLNDFGHQTLRFKHPRVTVVNVAVRFRTLGEKRNAAVALCRHDLIAVWDDDDIYLPHRLRYSVERLEGRRYFKPDRAFFLDDGVVRGPSRHLFHSASIWQRSLFDEVRGYAHQYAEDKEIEARFADVLGRPIESADVAAADIFYVNRLRGTDAYHSSWMGAAGERAAKVAGYAAERVANGQLPTGKIKLAPTWRADYPQLVADHLAALEEA